MKRTAGKFKSFEEQESYFLNSLAKLAPSEHLQALARLQKQYSNPDGAKPQKKITIRKQLGYGN